VLCVVAENVNGNLAVAAAKNGDEKR